MIMRRTSRNIITRRIEGRDHGVGPGVMLTNETFTGENFTGENFTGANLQRTKFISCVLSDASFYEADLRNCAFNGTNLDSTSFMGAKLAGVNFGESASMRRAVVPDTIVGGLMLHIQFGENGLLFLWGGHRWDSLKFAQSATELPPAVALRCADANAEYLGGEMVQSPWG